jgi:hypothetical protein
MLVEECLHCGVAGPQVHPSQPGPAPGAVAPGQPRTH